MNVPTLLVAALATTAASAGSAEARPTFLDPSGRFPTHSRVLSTTKLSDWYSDWHVKEVEVSAGAGASSGGCSLEAVEFIGLLNEYRAQSGLDGIPISPSLCMVSETHVKDLMDNRPDAGDVWGLHSWSDQGAGNWTACRFPDMSTQSNQNIAPSEATLECSWRKPSELTHYPGSGYENALWSGDPDVTVTPETALKGWQESVKHHELMTNGGSWVDNSFKAVGAGFLGEYAVMWVGEEVDPS